MGSIKNIAKIIAVLSIYIFIMWFFGAKSGKDNTKHYLIDQYDLSEDQQLENLIIKNNK